MSGGVVYRGVGLGCGYIGGVGLGCGYIGGEVRECGIGAYL